MKAIAFAGEYKVLSQLAAIYSDDSSPVNIKHREMANGEQVQILISADPRFLSNRYGWAQNAEHIFLCVGANDPRFAEYLYEEVKVGKFNKEQLTFVASADTLDNNLLDQLIEVSLTSECPAILCSTNNNDAYYIDGNITLRNDLKSIFDQASNKNSELNQQNTFVPPPEQRHNKMRDRFK